MFLDELSSTGYGLIAQVAGDAADTWQPSGQAFRDAFPGKPLQWALYSREHALELIDGTGWDVQELLMPIKGLQHHFICTPV